MVHGHPPTINTVGTALRTQVTCALWSSVCYYLRCVLLQCCVAGTGNWQTTKRSRAAGLQTSDAPIAQYRVPYYRVVFFSGALFWSTEVIGACWCVV